VSPLLLLNELYLFQMWIVVAETPNLSSSACITDTHGFPDLIVPGLLQCQVSYVGHRRMHVSEEKFSYSISLFIMLLSNSASPVVRDVTQFGNPSLCSLYLKQNNKMDRGT